MGWKNLLPLFFSLSIGLSLSQNKNGCTAPKSFTKITSLSKYLYFTPNDKNSLGFQYSDAITICQNAGLEIAEVTSKIDWDSLSDFTSDENISYWLGANDKKTEGVYLEQNGDTAAQFLAFGKGHPETRGDLDCIRTKMTENKILRMEDVSCESTGNVLCQFPKDSYCYINSFQHVVDPEESNIVPIDANGQFYISVLQKSRELAVQTCTDENLLLFYLDEDFIEELLDLFQIKISSLGLDPQTSFWTAGSPIQKNSGVDAIYWNQIDETVSIDQLQEISQFPFQILPTNVPAGQESCLDISFEDSSTLNLQLSNCLLPKYFICMKSLRNLTVSKNDFIENLLKMEETEESNEISDFDASCWIPPLKINLEGVETLSENLTFDLMMFVLKSALASGNTKIKLSKKILWRRKVLDRIFDMFKRSVSTELVPHSALNVVRELSALFLSSLEINDAINEMESWSTIFPVLDKCLQGIKPLNFITDGRNNIKSLVIRNRKEISISLRNESALRLYHLDVIVDSLWSIFSFSLGLCSTQNNIDPVSWSAEYYSRFSVDFMQFLMRKWINEDEKNILRGSFLLGDVDIEQTISNLRSAVAAAYISNGIENRQIVRPVYLQTIT